MTPLIFFIFVVFYFCLFIFVVVVYFLFIFMFTDGKILYRDNRKEIKPTEISFERTVFNYTDSLLFSMNIGKAEDFITG